MGAGRQTREDDAFLDQVLEAVLDAWSADREVSLDELTASRPDLRAEVERLVAEAREVAVVAPVPLPQVPGYTILHELGRGGMGVVYAARQDALGREVALKVLPWASLLRGAARQRFLSEARALARIRHPGIVTVYDVVDTGGLCAFAMEWVRGPSLAQMLQASSVPAGSGDRAALCRITLRVAEALDEMHRHGLVHRDVKPSNILLHPDGSPTLSDFGLVRDSAASAHTLPGEFVGTRDYASPEQLRGEPEQIGPASDVYSLGATLYHGVVGQPPFAGLARLARLEAAERGPSGFPAGLPRDLRTILGRCLEPRVEDRYATAGALAEDLRRMLALRPILARPPGPVERLVRAARRHRGASIALVSAALLVVVTAVAASVWAGRAATLPQRIAAHVHAARARLLEPRHEDRVLARDRGRAREDNWRQTVGSTFPRRAPQALSEYDAALSLAPGRADLVREREVVELASRLAGGDPARPSDELRRVCPVTAQLVEQLAAAKRGVTLPPVRGEDARLAGLLAFLVGEVDVCHQAWNGLDLDSDPFIDAATGQMLLAREEHSEAWPRLQRGLDAYPLGFLAVDTAECALRIGDVDAARRYLDRSWNLEGRCSFDEDLRLQAELWARDGDVDRAAARFDALLMRRRGESIRVRYIEALERRGTLADLREATLLATVLTDLEPQASQYRDRLRELADRWWAGSTFEQRALELVRMMSAADPEKTILPRIAAGLPGAREPAGAPGLCAALQRPGGCLGEVVQHRDWGEEPLRALELGDKRALAVGLLVADRLGAAWRSPWGPLAERVPALLARALAAVRVRSGALLRARVRWTRRTPTVHPSPRGYCAAAFVPGMGTVIFGGGRTDQIWRDTWVWNGVEWRCLSTDGPSLVGAVLVYDRDRATLLLLGTPAPDGETVHIWRWDGTAWQPLPARGGPKARFSFAATYDESAQRVIVYGGVSIETLSRALRDTWSWDGERWSSAGAAGPSGGRGASLVYDRHLASAVLFGGLGPGQHLAGREFRVWDGETWRERLSALAPSGRLLAGFVYVEPLEACAVVGGFSVTSEHPSPRYDLADTWLWDGRTAVPCDRAREAGGWSPRAAAGIAYDSDRGRVVVFGGRTGEGAVFDETWEGELSIEPR